MKESREQPVSFEEHTASAGGEPTDQHYLVMVCEAPKYPGRDQGIAWSCRP